MVLRRIDINEEKRGFRGVERIFVWLQIITAAYVAFAHGANDRSNAIGPMAAVWQVLSSDTGELAAKADIPLWLILLGSAGLEDLPWVETTASAFHSAAQEQAEGPVKQALLEGAVALEATQNVWSRSVEEALYRGYGLPYALRLT